MSYQQILTFIKKHNLKPASQRQLPLFTLSCIAQGYTGLLRQVTGFSYEALAAIGYEKGFFLMLDEDGIAQKTATMVNKLSEVEISNILSQAFNIFNNFNTQITEVENQLNRNPLIYLRTLSQTYPSYTLSIGVYNCFWRFLGNQPENKLSAKLIDILKQNRDIIAKKYPEIEKHLSKCLSTLTSKLHIQADLLSFCTYSELSVLLKKELFLTKLQIKDLSQRKKGYFYSYIEGKKETVTTDLKIINQIKIDYFEYHGDKTKTIKGFCAFPGKVCGKVINLQTLDLNNLPKHDFILVTSMTHPKDIMILKKSKAIITDEGGILCHAAIISRELKIPCIIGTKIATQVLKDGDLVEVDAEKGIINILKHA